VSDRLVIRGAREHNLRNVSLDLPRDRLIVFTGLSGSGKSSLAFDTIYARASAGTSSRCRLRRQFLGQMDKPDVRLHRGAVAGHLHRPEVGVPQPPVDGRHHHRDLRLPPVALRPGGHSPLSRRRQTFERQTPQQIVDRILTLPDAPASRYWRRWCGPEGRVRGPARRDGPAGLRPGPHRRRGGGTLGREAKLARYENHTIEVIVDRLVKRTASPAASPTRWRRRSGWRRVWPRCSWCARRRGVRRGSSPFSHIWPARCAVEASTSWRPATSRSTLPTAPARRVAGLARSTKSIRVGGAQSRSVDRRGPSRRGRGREVSTSSGC